MVQKQIAIYGKGGIGKSTVSSNVAVAMASLGKRVMLVGCDPKQDSTMALSGGRLLPSVLECMLERGEANVHLEDVCFEGPYGMTLVESGGPDPGVGCAGRGVITAFEILDKLKAFERFGTEVVIYDVLGDVVCGGFAMPLRRGYAKEVYLVTSGEMMALYAANNICRAIHRFARGSNVHVGIGGLILNSRNVPYEEEQVAHLAQLLGVRVAARVPRDTVVQQCEMRRESVITGAPDSSLSKVFIELAQYMLENRTLDVPKPLTRQQIVNIANEFEMTLDPTALPLAFSEPVATAGRFAELPITEDRRDHDGRV
ncbi:MAG TPA: nitrogenase iron protein NifH [Anaerolineae bacterium]|nr:nitrogenase iron protein NifH [Anaerolineae bacterium]